MIVKAYAKINLALDVVGKREDGYHLLRMIMQNIEVYDLIDISKINKGISLNCNEKFTPKDDRNIAYKAAKLFIDTYNVQGGVSIEINKNIPVAAGLAGGSTDAAAVLTSMRELYEKNISDDELMELAVKLGADVPFFIKGGTALCEGIGEKIYPLKPFKNHILVLIKPTFGVSTREIFESLDINKIKKHPDMELLIKSVENDDLDILSLNMKNVLENVTLKKYKVIRQIKNTMLKMGATGSMMSGSGPTVFGFFDDMLMAQKCFEVLKKSYDEVFITRTI